jgi:hypothetical protein
MNPMRHGIKRALNRAFDEGLNAMLAFYEEYETDPNIEAVTCRIVNIANSRARVEWTPGDWKQAQDHVRPLVARVLVIPERRPTDRNGVRPDLGRLNGRRRP